MGVNRDTKALVTAKQIQQQLLEITAEIYSAIPSLRGRREFLQEWAQEASPKP